MTVGELTAMSPEEQDRWISDHPQECAGKLFYDDGDPRILPDRLTSAGG